MAMTSEEAAEKADKIRKIQTVAAARCAILNLGSQYDAETWQAVSDQLGEEYAESENSRHAGSLRIRAEIAAHFAVLRG